MLLGQMIFPFGDSFLFVVASAAASASGSASAARVPIAAATWPLPPSPASLPPPPSPPFDYSFSHAAAASAAASASECASAVSFGAPTAAANRAPRDTSLKRAKRILLQERYCGQSPDVFLAHTSQPCQPHAHIFLLRLIDQGYTKAKSQDTAGKRTTTGTLTKRGFRTD